MQPSWRRIDVALLSAIMLFALATRLATINRPFHRDPEGCGSYYGLLARNYFNFGFFKADLIPIQSACAGTDHPTLYANHPPSIPLMVAASMSTFGIAQTTVQREWTIRLPTVLFTLATTALVFAILRSRAGTIAAAFGAFLFASMPITLIFGGQPDCISTQLIFFALLTLIAYERFCGTSSASNFALLCLAFLGAAMIDWPAFYLVVVIAGHSLIRRPLRSNLPMLGFCMFAGCVFAALYGHVALVVHDWDWMRSLVKRRTMSTVSDHNAAITIGVWLRGAVYEHGILRHTFLASALCVIWIVLGATKLRHHPSTRFIAMSLGFAAIHIAIGRQGVFVHEWWWWPLTPAVAMSAGVALAWLCASRATLATATVAVIALAGWNTGAALIELSHGERVSSSILDYSVVEIGEAIRTAPGAGPVLLAESDPTLSLWYYANRPIKTRVWDVETLSRRMSDKTIDLTFELSERCDAQPSAMIVPRAYIAKSIAPLIGYLDSHYRRHDTEKFLIYELREGK